MIQELKESRDKVFECEENRGEKNDNEQLSDCELEEVPQEHVDNLARPAASAIEEEKV